ncbi:MAG: NAD(P)-dependent glycerol-3-phosphate dehydrogenase [Clostridia bacterium]|nr:NAD(P)-dependent glycerol-3-phosphate dehydrogenase [Clostridia bacterium]
MSKIAVLGSGGWGTALAVMLSNKGHDVSLWSVFPEEIEGIKAAGENAKLLPGVKISESIKLTTDKNCVSGVDLVVMAVPSFAVRTTARSFAGYIADGTVVTNVAKGIEESTLKFLTEVISEELPNVRITALSGPSHAEEVGRGMPTSVAVASLDIEAAEYVQNIMMNETLRIYTNPDVMGVELSGAVKNVIALSAGVCDGMGYGDNTKAALITRGLNEITRIGVAMGATEATFAGLAGIGDLIVTCTSMHSRNRRFGILIGKGYSVDKALKEIGMTVEGYHAAKSAMLLVRKIGVEAPIIESCYRVLYENLSPCDALVTLMGRPQKCEIENADLQNWL